MELLRPGDEIKLTIQHDPLPVGFQVSAKQSSAQILRTILFLLLFFVVVVVSHSHKKREKAKIHAYTLHTKLLCYFNSPMFYVRLFDSFCFFHFFLLMFFSSVSLCATILTNSLGFYKMVFFSFCHKLIANVYCFKSTRWTLLKLSQYCY